MFRSRVLPILIWLIYTPLKLSWRIQIHESPELLSDLKNNRMVAIAHWHGDELLLIGAFVRSGMAIMASRSKDGELMKRVAGWLGYHVCEGRVRAAEPAG